MIKFLSQFDDEMDDANIGGKAKNLLKAYKLFPKKIPKFYCIVSPKFLEFANYDFTKIVSFLKSDDYLIECLEKEFNNKSFYAIRSSGFEEDSKENSFAGVFESHIGVSGIENIILALAKCIKSLNKDNVINYVKKKNIAPIIGASVIIQDMIFSSLSGILFSKHPISGENKIVINASYGLGDSIVEGSVTPDHVIADKDSNIHEYKVGTKKTMSIITKAGLKVISVERKLRESKIITESLIKELIYTSNALEALFEYPIDVEWAVEKSKLFILQVRPITKL